MASTTTIPTSASSLSLDRRTLVKYDHNCCSCCLVCVSLSQCVCLSLSFSASSSAMLQFASPALSCSVSSMSPLVCLSSQNLSPAAYNLCICTLTCVCFLLCAKCMKARTGGAVWSGDISGAWDSLRRQISCSMNFQMSGNPYWSEDIGTVWRLKLK